MMKPSGSGDEAPESPTHGEAQVNLQGPEASTRRRGPREPDTPEPTGLEVVFFV